MGLPVSAATIEDAIQLYEAQFDDDALNAFQKIDSTTSLIYQAQIMMDRDLDAAEDLIEKALEYEPENARVHFVYARVMAEQASNAFFSALSYAKRSLKGFKKAVQLEPDNPQYQLGLMLFYLEAPSIAGGDLELSAKVLSKILSLDREKGALAKLRYLRRELESEEKKAFVTVISEFPEYASLRYRFAQWQQYKEHYDDAFSTYEIAKEKLNEGEKQLQCEITYQVGKTAILAKTRVEQGIQAMEAYIQSCEIKRDMPNMDWARYRLANLLELSNQKDKAQKIYQSLKNSQDESLLEVLP